MEENNQPFLVKEFGIRNNRGNELRVPHFPVVEQIRVLKNFSGAFSIHIKMLRQNFGETILGDHSQILRIEKIEVVMIMSDVFLGQVSHQKEQNQLSELVKFCVFLDVMVKNLNFVLVSFFDLGHEHPLMFQNLVGEWSFLVMTDHLSHDIDRTLALLLPFDTRKIEFSFFNSLQNLSVALSVEWWVPTE